MPFNWISVIPNLQGQVDAETIQSYLDLEKEIAAAEQTRYFFHIFSIKRLRYVCQIFSPSYTVQYGIPFLASEFKN